MTYWFELLKDEEVIAKALETFKQKTGYDYSKNCAGDPLGQRLDDASFGNLKVFWAKVKAEELNK